MAVYKLGCVIGVSAITEVEAETEAQAIDISKRRSAVISPHGEGDIRTQWLVEEADGEPDEIHISGSVDELDPALSRRRAMTFNAEQIDHAADALRRHEGFGGKEWDKLPKGTKQKWREKVNAVIAALAEGGQ